MRRIMRRFIVVPVVCSAVFAMALPANAVIGGTPDGNAHPYVGMIFNDYEVCTGAAITATVVLTASHCLPQGSASRWTVTFSEIADNTPADGFVGATASSLTDYCFAHDCGNGLKFFASPDLAVLVLDRPVVLSRYAQLPSAGLVDRLPAKQQVTLAGYGVNAIATGGGPQQFLIDYKRRTASGTLSPNNSVVSSAFLTVDMKSHAALCFGDSGGPILLGDTVLGVMSFLNGQCTTSDRAFRIDKPDLLAAIRAVTS